MSNILISEGQSQESKVFRSWRGLLQDQFPIREREQFMFPSGSLPDIQREATTTVDLPPLNWELIFPKDPFSLSFKEFINLELNESEELLRTVYNTCKTLLKKTWNEGFRHAIVCGGNIVFKTADINDIPNETVKRLAEEHDKACFVFSAPDVVEDSVWTLISVDDSYPTLKIYLGEEDSDEKEIVEKTSPICADLDTGNPFYKIFSVNQLSNLTTDFKPFEMRIGEHLGRSYTYYNKRVKICIKDINGNINSVVLLVRLVRDWDGCALLQASPNRIGFLGRDVLRVLRVRLKLDSVEKTTKILDVS